VRPLETMSKPEFDVVVLGGGPAGCVLASRLTEEEERTVCLVEAGPDYGASYAGSWPEDLLDGRAVSFSHSWPAVPDTDRSQLRARVIGGCSTHNACAVFRGSPSDYEWGGGWTFEMIEPHLIRAERQLGVRRFDAAELSPWARAILAGAHQAGIARRSDPNARDAVSCVSTNPVNVRGWTRWNASFAYLDPARRRSNLTIADEAVADTLVLEGRRARGVLVNRRGRRLLLGAQTVIVTCGAYGSPLVLQRSGIGPAAELQRLGVPVVVDLPVGDGLVDHPGAGASWEPTDEFHQDTARFEAERPLFMGQVTIKAQSSACARHEWDVFVLPTCDPAPEPGRYEAGAAAFAMKPRSRGRVLLRSADPQQPPAVEHHFLADDADTTPIAEGLELVRRIVATEALSHYVVREIRPGGGATLPAYVRSSVRGFFHPVGTCALGPVCGPDARVHGFDNLYVGDASFLPEIPRANTQLTTLAVAERLAQRV
jgi:choline dehydrogenase-like flavoprotein